MDMPPNSRRIHIFKPDTIIEFIDTKAKSLRKRKRTLQLLHNVPIPQSAASKRELLRRASKLRVHEILHVYQVDHCIYYKCLMNGTGHLVEEFASPAHLCGIDLRKMQYRCGFDVATSWYRELAKVYESWKGTREARWYHQREKEATAIISAEKDGGGG
jgi:hypothetical protein